MIKRLLKKLRRKKPNNQIEVIEFIPYKFTKAEQEQFKKEDEAFVKALRNLK